MVTGEITPPDPEDDADSIFDSILYRENIAAKSFDDDATPSSKSSPLFVAPKSPKKTKKQILPPKVVLKLQIHEEVSSTQDRSNTLDDITSHVQIDGTVKMQLDQSSDSKNPNPPFHMKIMDDDYPDEDSTKIFKLDPKYVTLCSSENGEPVHHIVNIPQKVSSTGGPIPIATYHRSAIKRFLPLLVQSKVLRTGPYNENCMVAIQIRSNLNNRGPLQNLSVVVAIPPSILSSTLHVTAGNGAYDNIRRIVKFTLAELKEGCSLMLGVEGKVANGVSIDDIPKFPILLRCTSVRDTVSSVCVDVKEMEDHPATLALKKRFSYRLLHRLPP